VPYFVLQALSSHNVLCHGCYHCMAMIGIVLQLYLLCGHSGCYHIMLCYGWGYCMVAVGVVVPYCVMVTMGVTSYSVAVMVAMLQGGVVIMVIALCMVLLYCIVPHLQSLLSQSVVRPW
jgi:hypothetical protein